MGSSSDGDRVRDLRDGRRGGSSRKVPPIQAMLLGFVSLSLPACHISAGEKEQSHEDLQKIVVTTPESKDVIITQPYVCQIRSRRHINVRALQDGYLKEIRVSEGQEVKKGFVMFEILPTLYQAKFDAESAKARLARIKLENTRRLFEKNVVSIQDVALHEAELAEAEANAKKAEAELNFTKIAAPFEGIIDRLQEREGSLIKERDILTTLSDNSVMWVYFNVPEARYLEYMASREEDKEDPRIELLLANGKKFPKIGKIGAIEAKFNNETGNIPFRADFDNEFVQVNGSRLPRLRHGQTGTILIHRTMYNAIVIPQRATFEILDKRYVWVVGVDDVAHQRLITIDHELEDVFVIKSGLEVNEKIVLEGVREVHDGGKVEYEFRSPQEAMANQKNIAE